MCQISEYTYIDVGSNHPVRSNDFYRSYLNGNHGISIDPLPELNALYKSRKKDLFLNVACVIDKSHDYMLLRSPEHRLSSVVKTDSEHFTRLSLPSISPKDLIQIIDSNLPLVVKIDIEGGDIDLALEFFRTSTSIILLIIETFEGLVGSCPTLDNFENEIQNKYIKCAMTPHNNFYIQKEKWPFPT